MMKFNITNASEAFRLYTSTESEGDLFEIGWGDLRVYKKHKAAKSSFGLKKIQ